MFSINMLCLSHHFKICVVLLLYGFIIVKSTGPVNNRPIIGILAQDTNLPYGKTFISATYVKYLQQAGARVVPIRCNQTREYYKKMIDFTNGMLFPGGALSFDTSLYGKSARIIYDLTLKVNDGGDYYPLWGTCMGFQILCYFTQGENLLKRTDSNNASWPLNFTSDAQNSRMFGSAPKEILTILATQPDFESSQLSKFFTKLSTNSDRQGTEFISSVEAKSYPIYGVQWHPEKNSFNWNPNYVINHDANAVKIGQYMADFFVNESRKNQHKFLTIQEEANSMIENFKRIYFPDGTFNDFFFIDI
ncbi:hypothetical protein Btru_017043 [Bulinus truncatus]|nr:hypothetical protein Btru_017043 [Bulinus truncatus]